jgi:hypothetical protein
MPEYSVLLPPPLVGGDEGEGEGGKQSFWTLVPAPDHDPVFTGVTTFYETINIRSAGGQVLARLWRVGRSTCPQFLWVVLVECPRVSAR